MAYRVVAYSCNPRGGSLLQLQANTCSILRFAAMNRSTRTSRMRCLSLTFHCLSLTFHRLSLTVHRRSLAFHRTQRQQQLKDFGKANAR